MVWFQYHYLKCNFTVNLSLVLRLPDLHVHVHCTLYVALITWEWPGDEAINLMSIHTCREFSVYSYPTILHIIYCPNWCDCQFSRIFALLQFFAGQREFPIPVVQCVDALLPGQPEHCCVPHTEQGRSNATHQEYKHHLPYAHPLPWRWMHLCRPPWILTCTCTL